MGWPGRIGPLHPEGLQETPPPPPLPCHCRESVPPGRHMAWPWLFRAAAMLGPDPWGSLEAPRQWGELPVCPPATSPGCHVRVLRRQHPRSRVTPHTRASLALVPIRRGAVTPQAGVGAVPCLSFPRAQDREKPAVLMRLPLPRFPGNGMSLNDLCRPPPRSMDWCLRPPLLACDRRVPARDPSPALAASSSSSSIPGVHGAGAHVCVQMRVHTRVQGQGRAGQGGSRQRQAAAPGPGRAELGRTRLCWAGGGSVGHTGRAVGAAWGKKHGGSSAGRGGQAQRHGRDRQGSRGGQAGDAGQGCAGSGGSWGKYGQGSGGRQSARCPRRTPPLTWAVAAGGGP